MKIQKLLLVLFASFLLSLAFVSAAGVTLSTNPSSLILTNGASGTVNVSSNDLVNITASDYTNLTVSSGANGVNSHVFTITPTMTLSAGQIVTRTINFTVMNATNLSDKSSVLYTVTLKNSSSPLCSGVNPGALKVSNIDVNTEDGFGSDEDYWYPLDQVSIDFDVESPNYDIKDIEVTACLWDVSASECIIDEGDMDVSDDNFDLDENDDTTITLTFQVDPDTLKEGNTDYVLYISASGKINSDDSNDNLDTCASDSQDKIEIRTDEQFVVASNIEVSEPVTCNSAFDLSFDLWNIGDEDLDSDEVFVLISSSELGINQVVQLEKGIDAMESVQISESLKITRDVSTKTYSLTIEAYDDEHIGEKDIYQNAEDDDASWSVPVDVTSCSGSATGTAVNITNVELSDETPNAVIGSQLIVEATIKNTGSVAATYTIDVAGNSQWSNVATIDPKTVTLNAGESKKVSVYLDLDNSATTGEKVFTIKASSGTVSTEQQVKVILEKGITSSAIINHFKTNWVIYTIVLINLILIIAIILVVKSIVSSKD